MVGRASTSIKCISFVSDHTHFVRKKWRRKKEQIHTSKQNRKSDEDVIILYLCSEERVDFRLYMFRHKSSFVPFRVPIPIRQHNAAAIKSQSSTLGKVDVYASSIREQGYILQFRK
ncbi:hypothetical protein AVEN_187099-1 [Araneus ventricosus]|uniref:Uncharacterized protein n=1 Tax=Araneus ventricosus TaxID=182803 RepID=A0A4Y2UJX2_ARAVE|nr:hypothetical protein AVEN_187099-1 [Araneus ventricosus]